jgi:hypothetical protein
MADGNQEWAYYRAALRGELGPIKESDPQTGYYRHYTDNEVAIWREGGSVLMLVGTENVEDPIDQGRIWISCAKKPVSYDRYVAKQETGSWSPLPEATDEAQPGAGHNSGNVDAYIKMREELLGEVSESSAFYAKNPVTTKDDADRAQDWGDRLAKSAKAADKMRLEETEPLRAKIDEINAKWSGIIKPAERQAADLRGLAQTWGKAEAARLRKEAEEKSRREWEAQQQKVREEREAARKKAEEEAAAKGEDAPQDDLGFDLPLAPPPRPTVKAPDIKLGTGTVGNRRSVKTAPVMQAVIVNLKEAALYLVEQNHPELVALVQRLADKGAKSKMPMPGTQLVEKEETAA